MSLSSLPWLRRIMMLATALLVLATAAQAGLIMAEFSDPIARQPHRDKGLEFQNSVVSVWFAGGTHAGGMEGSGMLIGDGTCVLLTWHQLREVSGAPVTGPLSRRVLIRTGPNYLTDPGESVDVVDFIAHPNAPATGQLGSDFVVAKLARRPVNAKPLEITSTAPAIGDIIELAGFGTPANRNGFLSPLGELPGNNAPVDSYTDPQARDYLTTRFRISNSLPLLFGGTSYDSGGALARTVTDPNGTVRKELVGTIYGGTPPGTNEFTFSMNLARFRTWIHDQVAAFIAAPPVEPALTCALPPEGGMWLSCGGVPLVQMGGALAG